MILRLVKLEDKVALKSMEVDRLETENNHFKRLIARASQVIT